MNKGIKHKVWGDIFFLIGVFTVMISFILGLIFIFADIDAFEILQFSSRILGIIIMLGGVINSLIYFFISSLIYVLADIEYNTRGLDIMVQQIMKIKEYENDINEEEKTE